MDNSDILKLVDQICDELATMEKSKRADCAVAAAAKLLNMARCFDLMEDAKTLETGPAEQSSKLDSFSLFRNRIVQG